MNGDFLSEINSGFVGVRQVEVVYDIRLSMPLGEYVKLVQWNGATDTTYKDSSNEPIKKIETVIEECKGRICGDFLKTAVYFLNGFYYSVGGFSYRNVNKYLPPKDKTKDNYLEIVKSVSLDKVSGDMLTIAFYNDFFHCQEYRAPFDSSHGYSLQLMSNPNLSDSIKQFYINKAPCAWYVKCKMPIDSRDEFVSGFKHLNASEQREMLRTLCKSNVPWREQGVWECVDYVCRFDPFVNHSTLAQCIPFKDAIRLSFNDKLPKEMIDALNKRCQDEIFSREQESAN